MPKDHKQSTPRAGEGLPAGAARLGRAALQNHLLELQDALVDVEGVRHDDGVRDALPVVLSERASAAGVLGAVAGGVLGGHARELPQEAGGVRGKPAEDLGYERDDLLAARAVCDDLVYVLNSSGCGPAALGARPSARASITRGEAERDSNPFFLP